MRSYRPPNSVNVVTLGGQGGDVILTVDGDNLDNGSFQIHDLNSSVIHDLSISKTTAIARISCPANYMERNRTDTFILYSNGYETAYRISVTVQPYKDDREQDTHSNSNNSTESQANNNTSNDNDRTEENAGTSKNETVKSDLNGNKRQENLTAGNQWGTKSDEYDTNNSMYNENSEILPPDYNHFAAGMGEIANSPLMTGTDTDLNKSERNAANTDVKTARNTDSSKISSGNITAVTIVIILAAVTGAFLLAKWFMKRRRK